MRAHNGLVVASSWGLWRRPRESPRFRPKVLPIYCPVPVHRRNHFRNHLSETRGDGPTLPVTVSP